MAINVGMLVHEWDTVKLQSKRDRWVREEKERGQVIYYGYTYDHQGNDLRE